MFFVDEARIQEANDRTMREHKNLNDHVAVINEAWELLDVLRIHQPYDREDDLAFATARDPTFQHLCSSNEARALRVLSARLYNGSRSDGDRTPVGSLLS